MPLYLIHKTFHGEPIGIHEDDGTSHYAPGHAALEKKGTGFVGSKNEGFPWIPFVRGLENRTPQRDGWDSIDSPLPKERVLDELRGKYADARASE